MSEDEIHYLESCGAYDQANEVRERSEYNHSVSDDPYITKHKDYDTMKPSIRKYGLKSIRWNYETKKYEEVPSFLSKPVLRRLQPEQGGSDD